MGKIDFENIYDDFDKNVNTVLKIFNETYDTNIHPIFKRFSYHEMSYDIREELSKAFPDKNPIFIIKENMDEFDNLLNQLNIDKEEYNVKETDVKSIICDIGFFDELDNKIFFIIRMFFSYLNTIFNEFLLECIRIYLKNGSLLNNDEIEKKIYDLGRGTYVKMYDCISQELGITINLPADLVKDDIMLFYEIRNSYVHSMGRVNDLTLKKLKGTKHDGKLRVGRIFWINKDSFKGWHQKVVSVAYAIHSAMK